MAGEAARLDFPLRRSTWHAAEDEAVLELSGRAGAERLGPSADEVIKGLYVSALAAMAAYIKLAYISSISSGSVVCEAGNTSPTACHS